MRCASECNDRARDSLSASPSQSEIAAAQKSVESCAMKCVDDHMSVLKKVEERLMASLKQ